MGSRGLFADFVICVYGTIWYYNGILTYNGIGTGPRLDFRAGFGASNAHL